MKRKSIITVLGIAAVAALTPTVASAQGIFSVTIGSGSGYGYDGYRYGGYSNKSPVSISASTTTTIGATTRATEMMDITGTELA